MTISLTPPPLTEDPTSPIWQQWYHSLYRSLSSASGVAWATIDKAGSSIASLASKDHSELTNVLGGGSYHLSADQYSKWGTLTGMIVGTTDTQTLSNKTFSTPIISSVAIGTAPLTIASTTKVTNLNADMLDDMHAVSTATASSVVSRDTNGDFSSRVINSVLVKNDGATGTALRLSQVGGGGYATSVSSVTGAIKITLPVSWTSTMLRFTVKMYSYTGGNGGSPDKVITIAGYTYTVGTSWRNTAAYQNTAAGSDINVRFGHDGTNCCVWIGELADLWSYPQIEITDFEGGFSNHTVANWATGWTISFVTAFDTVNHTVVCRKPATITGTETLTNKTLTTPVINNPTGTMVLTSGSLGYGVGNGGAVTQLTSKSTAVTLNKISGEITLNNQSLAAGTSVTFSLTNSTIAATDVMILNHTSVGTIGAYILNGSCGTGSASITITNITAGALAEAIVLRFVVIKGSVT